SRQEMSPELLASRSAFSHGAHQLRSKRRPFLIADANRVPSRSSRGFSFRAAFTSGIGKSSKGGGKNPKMCELRGEWVRRPGEPQVLSSAETLPTKEAR